MVCIVFLFSCKKKKEPAPEPTPPQTPVYTISLKVDGVQKQCNSCYSGYKSASTRGSYFYLSGNDEKIYFSVDTVPAIGTYTLVKYGEPYLMYIKNNTYYHAVSGSINITGIDTSQNGVINKITASFNFKTDTTSNTFFDITEGNINLK